MVEGQIRKVCQVTGITLCSVEQSFLLFMLQCFCVVVLHCSVVGGHDVEGHYTALSLTL